MQFFLTGYDDGKEKKLSALDGTIPVKIAGKFEDNSFVQEMLLWKTGHDANEPL